jgi:hypothetical protein
MLSDEARLEIPKAIGVRKNVLRTVIEPLHLRVVLTGEYPQHPTSSRPFG